MEQGIKISVKEAALIEANTRDQSICGQWGKERENRLTASHFGEIITLTDRRDIALLCASMYEPKNLSHIPAIRHGNTYESVALQKFTEVTGKALKKSGFCVDPNIPYLGASPDSFLQDEDAVVEAKCPFVGRNQKIIAGKHFSFLERVGDQMRLKRTHKYYYQLVGEMKIAKKNVGYFIVYTYKDFFYERITLDEAFFNAEMLPKLKDFYFMHYLPYVASALAKK